ncbi:MAG TPA: extracellular solute-binding protein [Candidatus Binatia bacterium]|jgi:ABC-type Fe3+ transport system substrate-binding protein|nr:extracellular solute-binding protein [Candidatus Binatia bacterium]
MNRTPPHGQLRTKSQIPWLALLLALSIIHSFPAIVFADKLVLISPHWEGIRYEFERAFKGRYQSETGRTAELEWMDVGGSSETLRYLESEYKNKPAGIGIDIFFGGGLDPYLALKKAHLLQSYTLPKSLLEKIPPSLTGVPLYDPDHSWYGATLSGFGIVYNKVVLGLTKMPVITTWEDLASPRAFGWVGSSDPRKSGSVHMVYEIILQAYGWEKGWRIITGMGANVRNFTNSASQVPKDVAIGEVAYGLAIDFYAWAQVKEAGTDKIGFVMPDNLTIITPDAIAILKGAPNPDVAKAFIRFVMSAEGQKLWLLVEKSPGGPQRFQLNRFSVLPSLYALPPQSTAVKLNPFSWRSDFVFDPKLSSERWSIVNDLIGALVIDQKHLLTRAWKEALADGLSEPEWQRLTAMPISADEALQLAKTKWKDSVFRNQKLNEWIHFARSKYLFGVKPPIIRSEWYSLLAFVCLSFGLVAYSWKKRRGDPGARTNG